MIIGHGVYGKINTKSHVNSGIVLARKLIKYNEKDNKFLLDLELRNLQTVIGCRNVVQLIGYDNEAIYMEYIDGKSLFKYIDNKGMQKQDIINFVKQLLIALSEISERGITHGDIKSPNIMCKDGKITLIDFGISCLEEDGDWQLVSRFYRPPDIGYRGHLIDMWSLGVCIIEMIFGTLPYFFRSGDDRTHYRKMHELCNMNYDKWLRSIFPDKLHHRVHDSLDAQDITNLTILIRKMLCKRDSRICAKEALELINDMYPISIFI